MHQFCHCPYHHDLLRFLHDPKATEGFVGSALFAKMYRFFKTDAGDWAAEKVIDIPNNSLLVHGQIFRIKFFN